MICLIKTSEVIKKCFEELNNYTKVDLKRNNIKTKYDISLVTKSDQ